MFASSFRRPNIRFTVQAAKRFLSLFVGEGPTFGMLGQAPQAPRFAPEWRRFTCPGMESLHHFAASRERAVQRDKL
jgi:hypothetical protein